MKPRNRCRPSLFSFWVVFIAVASTTFSPAQSANTGSLTVRGRIVLESGPDSWGAVECKVSLSAPSGGQRLAESVTGPDGIFYFEGVPFGDYVLYVYLRGRLVGQYPIQLSADSPIVRQNGRFLDLAPIKLTVH